MTYRRVILPKLEKISSNFSKKCYYCYSLLYFYRPETSVGPQVESAPLAFYNLRDCWHTVFLCMVPRPQISTVAYEGICARVGECALESLNLHSHLPWVCPSYIFAVHYWSSKFKLILTSLFEDDNNSIFGSVTSLWTTMSVCLSVCPFVQKNRPNIYKILISPPNL